MGVVFLEHRRRAWQEKPRVHPAGLYMKASGDGGCEGRLRIPVKQPERAG